MAKTGRICGVCGDIGQIENLFACSVCKIPCEHTSFVQAPAPNQQGIWYCQTCRKKQTEMTEKRKSDKAVPTKKFENSKVKFLSSDEVISMSRGTVRQCIKTTTTSIASPIQTALPSGTPTRTQTSMAKSASERLLSAKKMLSREPGNASSSGSKEMGHKLSSLKGQLCLAPTAWKGSLEVHDLVGNTLVELVAYSPPQVSAKLDSAIEALPAKLQMNMVPCFNVWPKQFETDFPNLEDIGVYLLPSEKRFGLKCTPLLRKLYSREHALKMNVNAHLELVVYSSQILPENSQRIGGDLFFWGFFRKHKMRSGSKKKKFTSSDITPSKTSSELGARPDFRTPIARDKTVDILKHNQVDKGVIADISDVCEKSSWEVVVADTSDISPRFARPSIRQEISPMDKQSETSMRGKETQPVHKDVAPRCSSRSYIANKGSGCRWLFSSIGAGVLENALEGCENQEEYPEAQYVTNTTLEKRADEAESKRTSEQPNASQGILPNLGGSEIAPDTMPQQLDTPLGFGTSGQIFIKHEQEPLVPLLGGLDIPPGFSRRVEAREEKNVSNQQLETPPGFGTLGPILIKHEKEPLVTLPVSLEIPPGFSRRVEAREEKNISNECKGNPLSQGILPNLGGHEIATDTMPQQLDTPLDFGTSGQIFIKHEKEPLVPLSGGLEIPPGFSRKVQAREEKNVSNQQPETPPGFGTLGPILIKHEKEPLVALPVGLDIPPGFSRRVEAREEKNISNECKGSPLSMNQVLNVPRSVPTKFTDRPLLENQGIVHQQTPAYPVIQGTTSQSCSAQPTSPGGIHGNTSMLLSQGTSHGRAIPEVSLNHSQTIHVPTSHIQNYSEHSKITSIMHATGEKQRTHSSFTTPNVKPKAFESPDTDLTESYPEMGPKEASKNAKNNQEYYRPFSALYNANVPALTRAPSHFRVLNPSFSASCSRDEYHPSINKETAEFTATARGERSQRQIMRQSPVLRRERSRSRSPVLRGERSRSRSPVLRRERSRSRSPVLRRERSRSRSPVLRRERSRSRSPVLRRERSRSRSPVLRRHRSRSRSPVPRWHRSRSRSSPRWYGNPVYRQNGSRVRSSVRPGHYHDSGRYSSQYEGRCRSRYRGDSGSDSPLCRQCRNRSRGLSPPPSS